MSNSSIKQSIVPAARESTAENTRDYHHVPADETDVLAMGAAAEDVTTTIAPVTQAAIAPEDAAHLAGLKAQIDALPVQHARRKCEGEKDYQTQQRAEVADIIRLIRAHQRGEFGLNQLYNDVLYSGLIDPTIDLFSPDASKKLWFKKLIYCSPDKHVVLGLTGPEVEQLQQDFTEVSQLLIRMKKWAVEESHTSDRQACLQELQSWSEEAKKLKDHYEMEKRVVDSLPRLQKDFAALNIKLASRADLAREIGKIYKAHCVDLREHAKSLKKHREEMREIVATGITEHRKIMDEGEMRINAMCSESIKTDTFFKSYSFQIALD